MKTESIEIEKMIPADYWRLAEFLAAAKSISNTLINSGRISDDRKSDIEHIDDGLCEIILNISTIIGLEMHLNIVGYANNKNTKL